MTRRVGFCLALLLLSLPRVRAADSSPTERLMQVAACIREAGDMKGVKREAFMSECQAAKLHAADASVAQKSTPSASSGAPVTVAAPAPVVAMQADGLPPQERILGCATASKNMHGDQRVAYLKECLASRTQNPAIEPQEIKRRAACTSQAQSQPSAERQAFVQACMSDAVPGVVTGQTVPVLRQDSEPRRRAACNVLAQDRQGAQRQAFIEQCTAVRPTADSSAPTAALPIQRSSKESLERSKRCADEARAKIGKDGQIMAYMNACLAGH